VRVQDSRHFQLALHRVFHAESESAVRIHQLLHPDVKTKTNQSMRVSISYRMMSNHVSSPYIYLFLPETIWSTGSIFTKIYIERNQINLNLSQFFPGFPIRQGISY